MLYIITLNCKKLTAVIKKNMFRRILAYNLCMFVEEIKIFIKDIDQYIKYSKLQI